MRLTGRRHCCYRLNTQERLAASNSVDEIADNRIGKEPAAAGEDGATGVVRGWLEEIAVHCFLGG